MEKYLERLNKNIEYAEKKLEEAKNNYIKYQDENSKQYYNLRAEYLNGLKKAKELLNK